MIAQIFFYVAYEIEEKKKQNNALCLLGLLLLSGASV